MDPPARRDLAVLYTGGFLRSVATGLIAVLLGVYLFRIGYDSLQIGAATAAGLAGAAVATVVVTQRGTRIRRRRTLIVLSLLWIVGGLGLAFAHSFVPLLLLVFIRMVNALGTDRSAGYVLEQALLPSLTTDERRTWAISWYYLVLDMGGALGALAAGLPIILSRALGVSIVASYHGVLLGYAALGLVPAPAYAFLSDVSDRPSGTATSA